MKKSKIIVIIALAICGVLLISSVVFLSLNPRFFQDMAHEASNSKMHAEWILDANKTIDELDDTNPTGGASDAYYQAFLLFYGPQISGQDGSEEERVLLPSDGVSIPDKNVLYDKIKEFCKKYNKKVVEGTYESLEEQGYFQQEGHWAPRSDELCIRLFSDAETDIKPNKIEIMTGEQAGESYTFEKKNGTWKLTSIGFWTS